jgi:serine/threonine-protein kinase HipA
MEYRGIPSSETGRSGVWLHGEPVGTLAPGDGGYEFAWLPAAVERFGAGAMPLSRSLPVRAEPYGAERARPYFEGLLPDGMRRERIARELGLDPGDGLGLLAELGGDCPGAVLVLPEGGRPGEPGDAPSWLTDAELEELLEIPPPALFDPEDELRMRFALPGERHKLALIRDEQNDRWAWPRPGMPSTHVVKPETGEYPDFVANEVACTEALRRLGLPLAPLEPITVAGRLCAVAARFDRDGDRPPATPRHLETFWQALGFAPGAERAAEEADRPGFAHSAALLRAIGEGDAVETLFRLGFVSFLLGDHADDIVGRRDLHGRNASLLLHDGGATLGPFYGVASTDVYDSDEHTARTLPEWLEHTSGYIGLMRVGIECGRDPQTAIFTAMRTAGLLCRTLGATAEQALEEGWYRPVIDEIVSVLTKRMTQLFEDLKDVIHGPDGRSLREAELP